ncbi:MAG TPA: polysaccharide ABC transporter ATP-binding protein [Gaiellaceae bacterium]|nr:polysaccharide ABC transporter ATP-binding protein [Gaiellaceae bacterium]
MSSEPTVVSVEGLRKRYRLGQLEPYRALRDVLAGALAAPARLLRRDASGPQAREVVWALDGVSFELGQGEVLGLIGANGAGKSTLLKVLSRITAPTEGRVVIRGRVGSLLEVGTGFHPELTGRENIYLNGAILGMRKTEIDRRFDEIVEFSGIARFLDTPVKRFSSGMQVRLAFSVAAHLEPEILLVDEVLAVGDAEFQRKCLGKMHDVTRQGRTVIFVSHNLAAVRSLCSRALLLDKGRLLFDGDTDGAIERYLGRGGGREAAVVEGERLEERVAKRRLYGSEPLFRCTRIAVLDEEGLPTSSFRSDEEIRVAVDYTVLRRVPSFRILVTLTDGNQVPVLRTETIDEVEGPVTLDPGSYRSEVVIPRGLFGDAQLDLNVSLIAEVNQVIDYAGVVMLDVHFAGHGSNTRGKAYLRPQLPWQTRAAAPSAADQPGVERA